MKINTVVTNVVNDVTYSRKNVNTHVVITLLLHDVIHWKTVTSYDKLFSKILKQNAVISIFSVKTFCYFNRHDFTLMQLMLPHFGSMPSIHVYVNFLRRCSRNYARIKRLQ